MHTHNDKFLAVNGISRFFLFSHSPIPPHSHTHTPTHTQYIGDIPAVIVRVQTQDNVSDENILALVENLLYLLWQLRCVIELFFLKKRIVCGVVCLSVFIYLFLLLFVCYCLALVENLLYLLWQLRCVIELFLKKSESSVVCLSVFIYLFVIACLLLFGLGREFALSAVAAEVRD